MQPSPLHLEVWQALCGCVLGLQADTFTSGATVGWLVHPVGAGADGRGQGHVSVSIGYGSGSGAL